MNRGKREKLGELLLAAGLITIEQLQQALARQRQEKGRLGEILVDLGYVKEDYLILYLSEQLGIPTVDLHNYLVDPQIVAMVPERIARQHKVVPLFRLGSSLNVAMMDPLDVVALDEIHRATGLDVEVALAPRAAIETAIETHYGAGQHRPAQPSKRPATEGGEEGAEAAGLAEEAPIVRLVNELIVQAVQAGASDVHIEPDADRTRTRVRVDGRLREIAGIPKELELPAISRIKVLAHMDIANSRAPQDGRFEIRFAGREIGVRVSTLPTVRGENVVMRLLDKGAVARGIESLGLAPGDQKRLLEIVTSPHGLVLVTGPAGSGKTTTLYAILTQISAPEKNIVTIEDPVEYQLGVVCQSQVNPRAGLTFATGLRTILRQDPDIIMVGEIRDQETVSLAVQAALTGHLVLSTFHTNDAASALTRMIEMGVEPFLAASTVIGIVAQRLVRTVCEGCAQPQVPPPQVVQDLFGGDLPPEARLQRGRGCDHCRGSGYRGRTGIFEILPITEPLRALVVSKAAAGEIEKAARAAGIRSLLEDGLLKAAAGITTLDEVLRAARFQ